MKKIALLLVLVLALSICLTFTGVCFAWTNVVPDECFYEVTNQNGLQAYILDGVTYKASIVIPYSYFFKVTQSPKDGYYKISYNNKDDLYIAENVPDGDVRLTSYKTISDFQQGPYYTMALNAPSTAIQLYNFDYATDYALTCSSIIYIGYAKHEDIYYFLVKATYTIMSEEHTTTAYVKASDVLSSEFDPQLIPINPDSQQAKDDKNAKDIETAQNKLRRNIFFIVICVVCVVVVLLIYNPFKKKQVKKANPNMTSDDDF